MAIAAQVAGRALQRADFPLFDFDVYAICGDGCMMEGVSPRGGLARRPPAPRQPVLDLRQQPHHDRGQHALACSDDVADRFIGYGWNVTRVGDANDLELLSRAFETFRDEHDRPTLIIVDSHIGYGAPHKQDTSAAHGEPLGEDEIRVTKRSYGWPEDAKFLVPDGVCEHFDAGIGKRGAQLREEWEDALRGYRASIPSSLDQIERMQRRELPDGLGRRHPDVPGRREGHGDPRVVGPGDERGRRAACRG